MIAIRDYRDEDTEAIMRLFHDTVHAVNGRDYSPEQVAVWAPAAMDRARWAASLARKRTFVAEEEGTIVGFAELEGDGHVDRFYCHKEHQGQGVGTRLLATIEAEARRLGCPHLFAEVSITARPFFERRGFRVLAEQTVLLAGVAFVNYRMEKRL